MKKFIAVVMLLVILASAPAFAAKTKAKVDDLSDVLDEAAREFVKREKIPQSYVKAGDFYVIKSYGMMFKAIEGDGAFLYTLPDINSQKIMYLPDGSKLIQDADYVPYSGPHWAHVEVGNYAKGWVPSKFIIARDPE